MVPTLLTDDINTIVLAIARTYNSGLSVVFWAFLNQIFRPVNFAKITYASSATNNSFVNKQNQIWNKMRVSMKLLTKWL
jgi:CRISPR/Cas system CMR-associated protein Cmr3 (group 5 of RAMP superfamily)